MSRTRTVIVASVAAVVAGAGGIAVAQGSGDPSSTAPNEAVLAPAPNAARPDATHDPIAVLADTAAAAAPGVSATSVAAAAMKSNQATMEKVNGSGSIPYSKILYAAQDRQVIAFWGESDVCLRVRVGPNGAGGGGFCSTLNTANDPATPMYSAPAEGQDGVVVLLAPDGVQRVQVTGTSGATVDVPIANSVAVADVSSMKAISWTTASGKTYSRAASRP